MKKLLFPLAFSLLMVNAVKPVVAAEPAKAPEAHEGFLQDVKDFLFKHEDAAKGPKISHKDMAAQFEAKRLQRVERWEKVSEAFKNDPQMLAWAQGNLHRAQTETLENLKAKRKMRREARKEKAAAHRKGKTLAERREMTAAAREALAEKRAGAKGKLKEKAKKVKAARAARPMTQAKVEKHEKSVKFWKDTVAKLKSGKATKKELSRAERNLERAETRLANAKAKLAAQEAK